MIPVAALVLAQAPSPAPTLADLAFLEGAWVGEQGGGFSEERWGSEVQGLRLGTYRELKDGKVVFLEFMTLGLEDGRPVMRIRHFGPGLAAWEDKAGAKVLPLVKTGPGDATFAEGARAEVRYQLQGDTLTVTVTHPLRKEEVPKRYTFRRQK